MQTRTERIQKDIEALAQFTSTPGRGVTHSSYFKEDTIAKYCPTGEMRKIGLGVYGNGFGTLFGRHEGTMKDAPVVMLGSHYDFAVNGGAFDDIAGPASALEMMRVLAEEGFVNDYPLELILMNVEEGATFGPSTGVSNSRTMLGTMTQYELETVKDRFDQTKLEAMVEYGLKPDLKAAIRKPGFVKNSLELHIEQGPVLERGNIEIDLIRYLTGIGRYTIHLHGATADPTIPMDSRKGALVAAASFTAEFDRQIKALRPDVIGIVGKLGVTPDSNRFVSEYTESKIEIRTFSKEYIEKTNLRELITTILNAVNTEYGIRTEPEEITRISYPNPIGPSVMCTENVARVEVICEELGYSHIIINNGTGHDPMVMTDFCDINMIYVPSNRGGVSHCPEKWTEYTSIKKSADVLLHLVMDLSKNK